MQIISNSLKYTKKGYISVYCTSPGVLVIEDTGIGIADEDIKRIGQKGFTGFTGRDDKKSTGLGLYLSKEILKRLSHTITVTSKVDEGTKVTIDMNKTQINAE